jgi:hypothetical protein
MTGGESQRKADVSGAERRRSPRISIVGGMRGHTSDAAVSISVLDMSVGGFAMLTDTSFPIGVVHDFLLTPSAGTPLRMAARIVRTMASSGAGGVTQYISGAEFLTDENPITALHAVEECRRNAGLKARRQARPDAGGLKANRAAKGKTTGH